MTFEKFRYLHGVIAAHSEHTVYGRARLQKTVRLLQRVGLPTDYDYTLFFYGPYSEAVHFDLGLLKSMQAVEESRDEVVAECNPAYRIRALDVENAADVTSYRATIKLLEAQESVVLELAATYDAYREMGHNGDESLRRLRLKKGAKCTQRAVEQSLELLRSLKLSAA